MPAEKVSGGEQPRLRASLALQALAPPLTLLTLKTRPASEGSILSGPSIMWPLATGGHANLNKNLKFSPSVTQATLQYSVVTWARGHHVGRQRRGTCPRCRKYFWQGWYELTLPAHSLAPPLRVTAPWASSHGPQASVSPSVEWSG